MSKRPRRIPKLETWLNAVATPVYLVSAKRRVAFFNSGCEQLTGWPADQVVGQLCDYRSDGDDSGVEALAASLCPPPEVFAGRASSVPAYLLHRDGCSLARMLHFFPLKNDEDRVESILGVISTIDQPAQVVEESAATRLHAELAALRISLRQRYGIKTLVCQSDSMLRVLDQITLSRQSNVGVFLRGESGVGKEHIARIIHYESETRSRSFVPLDCRKLSALQLKQALDRVLETDPDESPTIEALQPGTLYLVDVECLPRDLQARLVEAFQPESREPRPDIRLMASSKQNLRLAVDDDRLRSDLFYLLTPLEIEIPPLRRRTEDLLPLAQHFLERLNRGAGKQVGGFDNEVQELFLQCHWPTNLDGLAAVIEEAHQQCTDPVMHVKHLPFRFRTGLDAQAVGPVMRPKPMPLEPYLADVEKEQIQLALAQCRNNKSKAAELLGITRNRLYRRMQALGIEGAETDIVDREV